MTRVRRALGSIAVVWLLCQGSALALAPTMLWLGASETPIECTCTHGDHAYCPMHHRPVRNGKTCVMGDAGSDNTAVLTAMLVGAGLRPPTATPFAAPACPTPAVQTDASTRSLRPEPPDPPPPRQ